MSNLSDDARQTQVDLSSAIQTATALAARIQQANQLAQSGGDPGVIASLLAEMAPTSAILLQYLKGQ